MKIEDLINKLFETREKSNSFHYSSTSRSMHKIMEEYYDEILEKVDLLVEVYIGKYGQIGEYINIYDEDSINNKNILEYFENVVDFINVSSSKIFDIKKDSHLLSIVDDIYNLLYRTIYKIKYLSENETH